MSENKEDTHKRVVQVDKSKGTATINGKIINKPHTVKHNFGERHKQEDGKDKKD